MNICKLKNGLNIRDKKVMSPDKREEKSPS